jgi:hypothetical protein
MARTPVKAKAAVKLSIGIAFMELPLSSFSVLKDRNPSHSWCSSGVAWTLSFARILSARDEQQRVF